MKIDTKKMVAILVSVLSNLSWGFVKDRATRLENLVKIVEKEHQKKTNEEEISSWLSSETSIEVKHVNNHKVAYFTPGSTKPSTEEIRKMAWRITSQISDTVPLPVKKMIKTEFVLDQLSSERQNVRQLEEQAIMNEMERLKQSGVEMKGEKGVPAKMRLRFLAKKNLKLKAEKLNRASSYSGLGISNMQITILKIFACYPKKNTMSIDEILEHLTFNGYHGRMKPKHDKVLQAALNIVSRLPRAFNMRIACGKVFIKLDGDRGEMYKAIQTRRFSSFEEEKHKST